MRALFDRWYPRLVSYLYARVGDLDHAEDLAQEAFVRLLEQRPLRPGPWLFAVATNLVRDEARLAKGRERHLALIRVETEEGCDPGPEPALIDAEAAARVRAALDAIPERARRLLLLHHAGFRYREIAGQLEVAPSSVGPLLTRAERRFLAAYQALHLPQHREGVGRGSP